MRKKKKPFKRRSINRNIKEVSILKKERTRIDKRISFLVEDTKETLIAGEEKRFPKDPIGDWLTKFNHGFYGDEIYQKLKKLEKEITLNFGQLILIVETRKPKFPIMNGLPISQSTIRFLEDISFRIGEITGRKLILTCGGGLENNPAVKCFFPTISHISYNINGDIRQEKGDLENKDFIFKISDFGEMIERSDTKTEIFIGHKVDDWFQVWARNGHYSGRPSVYEKIMKLLGREVKVEKVGVAA